MENIIYKFYEKTKGTISVFLVIIMVPMMVISSIFVDASRVKLAKGVVLSSADLALNTVLSNFDTNLMEFYGLMASAQNSSDVIAAAEEYFVSSLVSQGVSSTQAEEYYDATMQLFQQEPDAVSDLLGITTKPVGDKYISPATNGNLTNPAIVKTQIVEFMKYRAPLEAVEELISMFKKMNNQTKDSSQDAKTTEKMQECAEKQGDLVQELLNCYILILNYNNVKTELANYKTISTSFVKSIKTECESDYNLYKNTIHPNIFKYIANTEAYSSYSKVTSSLNYTDLKNRKYSSNTYKKGKTPSKKDTERLLTDCVNSINSFVAASNSLSRVYNNTFFSLSGANRFQYWVQNSRILASNNSLSNYTTKANTLLTNYAKLDNLSKFIEEEVSSKKVNLVNYDTVDTGGEDTISNHIDKIINQMKDLKREIVSDGSSPYRQIVSATNNQSLVYLSKCNDSNISFSGLENKRNSTNSNLKTISSKMQKYYNALKKADDYVKSINASLNKINKDGGLLDQFLTSYEEWGKAIEEGNKNTDINKANREAYNKENNFKSGNVNPKDITPKDIKNNVTHDSVGKLAKRFNNIDSLLTRGMQYINETKYGNKSTKDITDYQIAINASGISRKKIVVDSAQLEKNCKDSFKFSKSSKSLEPKDGDNGNPQISVATPELYKFMQKAFPDAKTTTDKDAEEKNDDFDTQKTNKKNSLNTQDKSYNGTGFQIADQPNLPSGKKEDTNDKLSTDLSTIASAASELLKSVTTILSGDVDSVVASYRDVLYEMTYIMEMFSYETYELEGKYELLDDSLKNKYSKCTTTPDYSSVDEAWKNEAKKFGNNKSLTNHMINENNNASYGNEVEYILYGGQNNKNKDTVARNIYMIRFVLNLIYGMCNVYNATEVVSLGASIQAATMGIVPSALTQLLVTITLTAMESVNDLNYLKKGVPVVVFKTKDTWKMSLSNLIENAVANTSETSVSSEDKAIKFQYSDYLRLFLFISLVSDKEADLLLRTADVIQFNMQKVSKDKNFLMENSIVYYKLEAKCTSKVLMLSLPLIQTEISEDGKSKLQASSWNEFKITVSRGY